MHTPRGRALLWKTPDDFGKTNCMQCRAGWTRAGKEGHALTVCLLDREPVMDGMTACDRFEERPREP